MNVPQPCKVFDRAMAAWLRIFDKVWILRELVRETLFAAEAAAGVIGRVFRLVSDKVALETCLTRTRVWRYLPKQIGVKSQFEAAF